MNPDVVDAIGTLRKESVLSESEAARFLRVARRELVSVRFELRALLYAGVLLVTSGVGLFIKEHRDELGPAVIGALVGIAAAACLFRVARTAPPFSWGETPAPNVAFDYVLLLGLLLLAADLAYLEVEMKLLGPNWPYHFLLVAVLYFLAAYRWDSRAVLALALTSFAAWRGVSVNVVRGVLEPQTLAATRANALSCGALFLLGAAIAVLWKKKAHFEGVYGNLGLLLLLGGLLSGVFGERSSWGYWFAAAELQDASPSLAMRGGVGATSFWAVVFALTALFLFVEERRLVPTNDTVTIVFAAGAVLWAAAAWRWGIPVYAAFSAIALFAFFARFPAGRLLWIAGGTALAFASARFFDDRGMAPSHCRALTWMCAVSLAAVYGAVNVYSLDWMILDDFRIRASDVPATGPALLRLFSILGTVLVPVLVLAWGVRARRTFLVDLGIVLVALSFVTLRYYVHIAPLWAILTGSGAILLAVAVLCEKQLRRAPEGEVGGFTADPLFEDEKKKRGLEVIPIVAGFGAQAPEAAPASGRFEGGGGSGGGGGTTDSF